MSHRVVTEGGATGTVQDMSLHTRGVKIVNANIQAKIKITR